MTRFKLRIQFFLLTLVLLAGFAAFGLQTLSGLGKVKVGGLVVSPGTGGFAGAAGGVLPPAGFPVNGVVGFLPLGVPAVPDDGFQPAGGPV